MKIFKRKQPTEQEIQKQREQALAIAQNKVRSAISHDYHYKLMTAVIVKVH